jgi:peptide/nickel transport system substrate-binding protein
MLNGRKTSLLTVLACAIPFVFCSAQATAASPKKLLIAVTQEPTTIEPSLAWVGPDYALADNLGEYLVCRVPNGELKPGLATSWKISPDGKVIEFTLREGVKFHSGDPLTVKDVEFSYERGRAKNQSTRTRLKTMEKFEVIDDYHFKIHLNAPDVTFIPNRGSAIIVSKSYYDRAGEEKFVRNPVGTGPYKFVRHAPGEYIDVERFEDYWGEKPSVKEARFSFVPEDTTRVAKLKAGEVDFISNCPYPSVQDVEKTSGLRIVKFASNHPTVSVLFANRNTKMPWHLTKVRQAMAYAIDCDSIIKNVLYGIPNRWAFLAPHELGYDPDLKPYPYDPKKAKELLAEAGYPKGFDLKLYWVLGGEIPLTRETSEAIASYFEAVGIRTKLVGEEYATAYARRRSAKGPDVEYVAVIGHGRAGGPDATYYVDLFFGMEAPLGVYYNPELDKVNAVGRQTVDDKERAVLIKKAIKIIYDDVASIPLYNPVYVYAMKKNIDFVPTIGIVHNLVLLKDVTLK